MQMSGQERIAAPRQQVWDALDNPELLKRCIPGCQSIAREEDGRLRAIAEIKIGPIGARFNALVARKDVAAPTSYTMVIEAQGGTVGFVKSDAKVRLSDEGGGTLLSYDVEANIGGRLAQLGGAMLDATAKQLAGRFFKSLSANIAGPAPAAVASAPSVAPATYAAPAVAAPRSGSPIAAFLAMTVAALVGYLIGAAERGSHSSDWMGMAIGLLVLVVAGVSFEYGRRAGAPTLVVDSSLLARLADEAKR